MTLKERRNKKDVTVVFSGDTDELNKFADALDKLKDVATFDLDNKPLKRGSKSNVRRVAIAQEGGVVDPLMYIKLNNAIDRLSLAFRSQVASTEIDFAPNELTPEVGDTAAAGRLSRTMNEMLNVLDNKIIKRRGFLGLVAPGSPNSVIGRSQYEVVFPYDISEIEQNVRGGVKLEALLEKGEVIPEYGETLVPPVERKLWKGSTRRLMNKAVVVVVRDNAELATNANAPAKTIVVDSGLFKKFVHQKPGFTDARLDATNLNWFREMGSRAHPKSIEDLLGMAVTFAASKEYGLIAPRLIKRPEHMTLKDPRDNNKEKWYYVYVVGGYSPSGSARRVSQRAALEDAGGTLEFD